MEKRTAFWQRMPKRPERIVSTMNGVIRVHADCLHLRQNWWIAARRFRAAIAGKQPFVHVEERGWEAASDGLLNGRIAPNRLGPPGDATRLTNYG